MDEEIKCIENNQTWKLVDVHNDKDVIVSSGFINPSKMQKEKCRSTRKD